MKQRKDAKAQEIFQGVLKHEPENLDAQWGIAEVLRRQRRFKDSKDMLANILACDPGHSKAKISMAYICYHDKDYRKSLKIVNSLLAGGKNLPVDDLAMTYMLLGCINADFSSCSIFLGKLTNGLKVRSNFETAKILAPDSSEVCLGLGSFYLCAPKLFGGDLVSAISELEKAIAITPDFATPYARLAEAYYKKGDVEKSKYLLIQAMSLDPENEAGLEFIRKAGLSCDLF